MNNDRQCDYNNQNKYTNLKTFILVFFISSTTTTTTHFRIQTKK